MTPIRTERLILRQWRAEDRAPYASMNADPVVRRWFVSTLTENESDAQAARIEASIARDGFGFWAVEAVGSAPFIGFVGLQRLDFAAPFTPAVEIGWRLAQAWWGHGYATEAARAALAHGFDALALPEIVACIVPGNAPSRAVAERIGMECDPADDFDHPAVPAGHALERHVLYRARGPGAATTLSPGR